MTFEIGQRVSVAPLDEDENSGSNMDGVVIEIDRSDDDYIWYRVQLDRPFMGNNTPIDVPEFDLETLKG